LERLEPCDSSDSKDLTRRFRKLKAISLVG
jgi:hypothetical protein